MRSSGSRAMLALAVACAALAGCDDAPVTTAPEAARLDAAAPLLAAAPGKGIRDRYIVVFHDDTEDAPGLAKGLVAAHGGTLHFTYRSALRGFAATLPPAAVEAIRRHPGVAYVEEDFAVTPAVTQSWPQWGLDRIDQPSLPLNDAFVYTDSGVGVRIYVVDSGIRMDHTEFAGPNGQRVQPGFDPFGGNGEDCTGHGTAVASAAAGRRYGVAKGATLISVRVFPCEGVNPGSAAISGVEWITENHVKPAVANMSLSSPASSTFDNAVARSIAAGVTYVVAAGNDSTDACGRSPARLWDALTVGASTRDDARASFSNHGRCLDLFAPGQGIQTASFMSPTGIQWTDGTSIATPHVAGVAAVFLQRNPTALPETVRSAIVNSAYADKLSDIQTGSPNRLLSSVLRPPVVASVSCTLWSGSTYSCTAQASGGSGSGYSFAWGGSASEYYDQGGTSRAYVPCQRPTGSYQGTLSAYGTATDGNGLAAPYSLTRSC